MDTGILALWSREAIYLNICHRGSMLIFRLLIWEMMFCIWKDIWSNYAINNNNCELWNFSKILKSLNSIILFIWRNSTSNMSDEIMCKKNFTGIFIIILVTSYNLCMENRWCFLNMIIKLWNAFLRLQKFTNKSVYSMLNVRTTITSLHDNSKFFSLLDALDASTFNLIFGHSHDSLIKPGVLTVSVFGNISIIFYGNI